MASKRVIEVVVKVKDQASAGFDKVSKKMGGVTKGFKGMSLGAAAAAAAVVFAVKKMVDGLAALVNGVANVGDEFDKMSFRSGVAVDALARWVFISKLAGGSASTIEVAFKKLSKSMFDAQKGLATAVDAFDLLDISVMKADGTLRSNEDVMMDLAEAFSNSTQRVRDQGIAMDLLGRGGLQMLAILTQGSTALASQADEYDRLHGSMKRTAEAGAAWVDANLRMQTAMAGMKEQALTPVLETLTPMINKFARLSGAADGWGEHLSVAGYYLGILTEEALAFADVPLDNVMMTWFPPEMFGPDGTIAKAVKNVEEFEAAMAAVKPGPTLARDFAPAEFEGYQDEYGLLEDLTQIEADRAAQSALSHEAEAEALMAEHEMLIAAGAEADLHIKRLEDSVDATSEWNDVVTDVVGNFERLASNSLSAMFQATNGAIMFGRALKTIVLDALSAVIAKMIAVRLLGFALGMFGGGGSTLSAEFGGGYSSAIGPGLNGAPLGAAPGNLVSMNSASMVSPSRLGGGGGGGGVSVTMQVARPVGYLDVLDLGEAAAVAALKVSEATL